MVAVVGAITLITLVARKYIEHDRSSPETALRSEGNALPSVTNSSAAKKSPAIDVSQKVGITKKSLAATPGGTRPLTLAAELKSANDKDVSELAEISRRAVLCQARREVLKRGDAFEQDIAAAK